MPQTTMDRFSQESYHTGSWILNVHGSKLPSDKLEERTYTAAENRWSNELKHYNTPNHGINSSVNSVQTFKNEAKSNQVEKGSFLHLVSGGIAGCASTLVTCPIDVIKTRQQSSGELVASSQKAFANSRVPKKSAFPQSAIIRNSMRGHYTIAPQSAFTCPTSLLQHGRYILQVEGLRSFYKGLGPSLVGVVPSRALFFFAYDGAKKTLRHNFGFNSNSWNTHVLASTFGGFISCSATCPLWVLKTKQQLHRRINKTSLSTLECIRRVWKAEGAKGFYRGLTASYAGIVETVVYFTIYEQLKAVYVQKHQLDPTKTEIKLSSFWQLPGLMLISSLSKCTATCLAYPHEVIRTRLREEPVKMKYSGFFQTARVIAAKEGPRALYGGLPAQLIRQVPNMAILMGVYEGVVYLFQR